jgi:uncharacterized protein (DUF2384 family)
MAFKTVARQMEEERRTLKENGRLHKSQIKGVPDLIWSLALISINSNKEHLKEWFNSPVPAFNGRKPIDVLNDGAKGEKILFEGLKKIQGGFPCGD